MWLCLTCLSFRALPAAAAQHACSYLLCAAHSSSQVRAARRLASPGVSPCCVCPRHVKGAVVVARCRMPLRAITRALSCSWLFTWCPATGTRLCCCCRRADHGHTPHHMYGDVHSDDDERHASCLARPPIRARCCSSCTNMCVLWCVGCNASSYAPHDVTWCFVQQTTHKHNTQICRQWCCCCKKKTRVQKKHTCVHTQQHVATTTTLYYMMYTLTWCHDDFDILFCIITPHPTKTHTRVRVCVVCACFVVFVVFTWCCCCCCCKHAWCTHVSPPQILCSCRAPRSCTPPPRGGACTMVVHVVVVMDGGNDFSLISSLEHTAVVPKKVAHYITHVVVVAAAAAGARSGTRVRRALPAASVTW